METKAERKEVGSLCPECGHAFKTFVDRVVDDKKKKSELPEGVSCPVCGCGQCSVIHSGSSYPVRDWGIPFSTWLSNQVLAVANRKIR